MKRIIFFACAIAFITIFSSCNKEKTCICTTSYSGVGTDAMPDVTTKFETEEKCSSGNTETSIGTISTTTTCVEE